VWIVALERTFVGLGGMSMRTEKIGGQRCPDCYLLGWEHVRWLETIRKHCMAFEEYWILATILPTFHRPFNLTAMPLSIISRSNNQDLFQAIYNAFPS
jgi:hypothetical protein